MEKVFEALEKFKTLYESKCKTQPNNLIGFDMCYVEIKKALQRLEEIDNAKPSEALKNLRICWSGNESMGDYLADCEYEEIEQALLKAQDLEKENQELLQVVAILKKKLEDTDNIKVATIMMKQLDTNIKLEKDLEKYKKVLELIKEYQVDIWLLLQCDYENYVRIRKEALIENHTLVNEDGNVSQDIIPEEIFYLLKEKMK